jgi:hypothetical protein
MAIAKSLPLELWLIIFEMALDPMNDPPGGCSYRIFPEVDFRLRSPWTCIPMDQLRQSLRLVSRTFNNMILSSPDSMLIKSGNSVIPPKTRSVCISQDGDSLAGFRQLLAQPGASSRISTLVMPLQYHRKDQNPIEFDLLCENGSSLPGIRRLTLVYPASAGITGMKNLWSRINNAFPLLICLVLGTGIYCSHEATNTTFKKLEILHVHCLRHTFRLRFPLLRHVVVTSFTNAELEVLERSIHLESMLVHHIHGISRRIDWRGFEQLRLLGVPLLEIHWIAPFPPNHPLDLLYVFMDPQKSQGSDDVVRMVQKMVICLPTVTQIHVDIENLSKSRQLLLERELLGTKLASKGLHVRPLCTERYQLVIERIPSEGQAVSEPETVTRSGVFKSAWTKLTRFGSGKLLM